MAEFIALDRVEPWGEWRADLRAGIIASVVANVNRGKKSKTFKPSDFMPDFRSKKQKSATLSKQIKGRLRGIMGGPAEKKGD